MPICGRGNYIPIDKGGLGLHVPAAKLKLIYNMRKCGDPVVVEVANHEYWLREREREREERWCEHVVSQTGTKDEVLGRRVERYISSHTGQTQFQLEIVEILGWAVRGQGADD